MIMKNRFSKGNRKLSKKVLIWNLPRNYTCPGAGACLNWCYEIKIERMYKQVVPFRIYNLELSLSKHFSNNVISFLNTRKEPYVRIHECGDFYDQKYLDKWKEIARACPDKKFFCFTKSFKLDLWSNLPRNFQIMQSTGSKYDHLIDWKRATNRAKKKSDPVMSNETLCSGTGCGDTCTTCIPQSNIHLVENIH